MSVAISDTATLTPLSDTLFVRSIQHAAVDSDTHWLTDSSLFLSRLTSNETLDKSSGKFINIFQGHELRPRHEKAVAVHQPNGDWLFLVILAMLGILAYAKTVYTKYLNQIFSASLSNHLTNQLYRDENLLVQRAFLFLMINFCVAASVIIYLLLQQAGWQIRVSSEPLRFILVLTIVTAAVLLKFAILRICGYLFHQKNEMALYSFNIMVLNSVLSFILIPVAAFMLFSTFIEPKTLVTILLSIIGLTYIYRIFRGFRIGLSYSSFSPFYLFLYLCALEISPLLVFIKLITLQE